MVDIATRCFVPGCDRRALARQMCAMHYQRWSATGSPGEASARKARNGGKAQWLRDNANYSGDGCLRFPFALNHRGYGYLTFDGSRTTASRAMCIIAHGEPPTPEHQAAHSCGKGHEGCVNPGHLRWATQTENMADQLCHGTRASRERHGMARLTADQVAEIKRRGGRERQKDIAKDFGVRREHVGKIIRGDRWSGVQANG